MNNQQKISKIFDGTDSARESYLLGKALSIFLLGQKTFTQKKRFMRKMFRGVVFEKMYLFKLLAEIIEYEITSDDIMLYINKDFSLPGLFTRIKETKKNFGETISKEIFQRVLKVFNGTDVEDQYCKEKLLAKFPEFC